MKNVLKFNVGDRFYTTNDNEQKYIVIKTDVLKVVNLKSGACFSISIIETGAIKYWDNINKVKV